MGAQDITQELTQISGMPFGRNVAAVVGDTLNFATTTTIGSQTVTATRKPATSANSVSGTTFTFDVPGYYTFTSTNAGLTRTVTVIVFMPQVLAFAVGAGGSLVTRATLLAIANDPAVTQTSCTNSIELSTLAAPTAAGLNYGLDNRLIAGLNLRAYTS